MKTLQELTLLDKFLFDEAMEDMETYEALLRILLGDDEINLLSASESEKEFRTAPWLRTIRVDVFSMDGLNNIYSTEMQKQKRDDLCKRSRYYQALIDSSLLAPGEISFNTLKNTTIIMIAPFDLFGMGKYIYTFEETCSEVPNLKLGDGAKRIFINTRGENKDDVSSEFIALMEFIEYNKSNNVSDSLSANYAKIVERVMQIKDDEKVGVRYMQKWEEEALIKQEGRKEGKEEGKEEGKDTLADVIVRISSGESPESIIKSGVEKNFVETAQKVLQQLK